MDSRNSKWEGPITVVLVICALITTGLVIRREFLAARPGATTLAARKPLLIENWQLHLAKGTRFGSADAPVQLIEFSDFECPFCASFHASLKELRDRYPNEVAVSFVHYPLPGHRFAEPAARAAECAGRQGRFEVMQDRMFEQQAQLGLKSWRDFADEAGVTNLRAFDDCIQETDPMPTVVEGLELGEQLGIRGTPTVIINGWQLSATPSTEELHRMIRAVLAGNSPVSEED